MVWGNLAALSQDNVKRLLAYSSIAHAGYMLIGVAVVAAAASAATREAAVASWLMVGSRAPPATLANRECLSTTVRDSFAVLAIRRHSSYFACYEHLFAAGRIARC